MLCNTFIQIPKMVGKKRKVIDCNEITLMRKSSKNPRSYSRFGFDINVQCFLPFYTFLFLSLSIYKEFTTKRACAKLYSAENLDTLYWASKVSHPSESHLRIMLSGNDKKKKKLFYLLVRLK